MKESEIQNKALLALSKGATRLFRNNTAVGWSGNILKWVGRHLTILDPRPIHAGLCKGSSDTIGWHSITITPAMVGTKVAVFTAIEFKAQGKKPTDEQLHFGHEVLRAGGIFGVAWTVADAVNIVDNYGKSLINKGEK
jgi:hypothetical protein